MTTLGHTWKTEFRRSAAESDGVHARGEAKLYTDIEKTKKNQVAHARTHDSPYTIRSYNVTLQERRRRRRRRRTLLLLLLLHALLRHKPTIAIPPPTAYHFVLLCADDVRALHRRRSRHRDESIIYMSQSAECRFPLLSGIMEEKTWAHRCQGRWCVNTTYIILF